MNQPALERSSGVLLHVTSLPSRFGIGDLGPTAFEWVDWLAEADCRYWQLLPLGPTGLGNSPYSSFSSFAGNATLIAQVADSISPPSGIRVLATSALRLSP